MTRTVERAIYALLLLAVVASGFRAARKADDNRTAFTRWQHQLLQLKDGVDISAAHNYPNPPVMAVLLEPLAHLPPVPGAMAWFALKALMAGLSFYGMCRLVEGQGEAFAPWARVLAALLCLKPVLDDLTHGNVNLFILALVVGCFAARRARHDGLAGLLLALAVACKVTPALLVPYFVYKRAWRLLLGVAAGMLLFFYPGFVPAARLGMTHNLTQLTSWYRVMVHPFVVEGAVTAEHINQSLPGLAHRLLTRSPSFVDFKDDVETPMRYDNVASLPPETVRHLTKGCLLGFGLLVLLTCRSPGRDGWRVGAEYGLIVLGMLLFSERTWKHHAVTLMVPFVVLAYRLAADRRLWGVVVACAVLMVVPGLGGGGERETVWASPPFAKMTLVYGAYTWLFILLAGTMAAFAAGASPAAAAVIPATEEGAAKAA
ncbi:MAG: glycosyltransferase family 87 protein [Gemmataceae bacterium]